VAPLAVSPDGTEVCAGWGQQDEPGNIKLWNLITGKEIATLRGHQHSVNSVTFSPDGLSLASGSGPGFTHDSGEVKIWNPRTGEERATLGGYAGRVYALAFSPSGKMLATENGDYEIRLHRAASDEDVYDDFARTTQAEEGSTRRTTQLAALLWRVYLNSDLSKSTGRKAALQSLQDGLKLLRDLENSSEFSPEHKLWKAEFESALWKLTTR
jgi:WD40 repeat protein